MDPHIKGEWRKHAANLHEKCMKRDNSLYLKKKKNLNAWHSYVVIPYTITVYIQFQVDMVDLELTANKSSVLHQIMKKAIV